MGNMLVTDSILHSSSPEYNPLHYLSKCFFSSLSDVSLNEPGIFSGLLKQNWNINCCFGDIIPGQCGLVSGFPQFHVACHGVTMTAGHHPKCSSVPWPLRVGQGYSNQHLRTCCDLLLFIRIRVTLSHYKLSRSCSDSLSYFRTWFLIEMFLMAHEVVPEYILVIFGFGVWCNCIFRL